MLLRGVTKDIYIVYEYMTASGIVKVFEQAYVFYIALIL